MMPPIPKKLLIHSAELITEFSPDKWGKASERETVKLEHVRVEPSEKYVIGENGETLRLSAVLFFDCRNSFPQNIKFALKDDAAEEKKVVLQKVSFGGRLFTVHTVKPLYADKNRIHHYEIELV